MKKVLTTLLVAASLNFCKAEPPINLHLPKQGTQDEMVTFGAAMAVSGALLCTGLLLEGSSSYSSAWKMGANGKMYRDEIPFLMQTPKNIFFAVGTTMSITGVIVLFKNIERRRR